MFRKTLEFSNLLVTKSSKLCMYIFVLLPICNDHNFNKKHECLTEPWPSIEETVLKALTLCKHFFLSKHQGFQFIPLNFDGLA